MLACCLSAPPEIVIDSENITLGALIPFPASDVRASISFGYAPNPGLARRIPKYEIVRKLNLANLPVDDLQIPESILVQRRAVGLDRDQVTRTILDAFTQRYSGANIEITNVELPPVQVGTGPVDISATLPAKFDPSAPVFVRIDIRGTSFARNAFVRTNVRIETEQPVLRNKVAAHSAIQASDVEMKPTPVRGDVADQFDGMLAKRDLESGQVLTKDLLYMPLYVQKGDAVTVKASSGGITIAATMRAKASGKYGDTIPVEHLTGQGSTMARIVGPRTLETISNVGPAGPPSVGTPPSAASLKGDWPVPPRTQGTK
jgi:flagella basal body P-ring formation protein FlgA